VGPTCGGTANVKTKIWEAARRRAGVDIRLPALLLLPVSKTSQEDARGVFVENSIDSERGWWTCGKAR
jgi:hypothetical protein